MITAILCSLVFTIGCARSSFDISNETDRLSMKIEIRNALTSANCTKALDLSGQLYNSAYSDNDVRMLYASAHACNIGIKLYDLIDRITTADFSSGPEVIKSLVRLFPSRTALDSRLQSGWYAQDALQSILKPGTVIGPIDQINPGSHNPGSVLLRDRTDDANVYLVFIAMSEIGTTLNRYGYNASDDPAAHGYKQMVSLSPWMSLVGVKNDSSGAACGLASSMLNMFDGIHAMISVASGSASQSLNNILNALETVMNGAASAQCSATGGLPINDGFTQAQCDAAVIRLRNRVSCTEQDPIASVAAGIIRAIDLGWQDGP